MNEKQVLELMRRVIECGDVVGRLGMLNEIERRIAALPAAAQAGTDYELYMTTNRAAILSETNDSLHRMISDLAAEAGKSHGVDEPVQNCAEVSKALAARDAQADGEPSFKDCMVEFVAHCSDIRRADDVDAGISAVRSLMLRARPAPSQALVDAADAMRDALESARDSLVAIRDHATREEERSLAFCQVKAIDAVLAQRETKPC